MGYGRPRSARDDVCVDHIEGVVHVQHNAARHLAKAGTVQPGASGKFSSREMVGCEQSAAP
jgi:hypothetical protein